MIPNGVGSLFWEILDSTKICWLPSHKFHWNLQDLEGQLTKRAVAGISIAIVLSLILSGGITFLVLLKIYAIWAKAISSSSSVYHGHDFELKNEECKQTFESMVEETYITQDDYNTGSSENHNLP